MKRRELLATAAVVGVAGCSSLNEPTHSMADDAWALNRDETERYRDIISGTVTLSEGEFAARTANPSRSLTLDVNGTVSDPVDYFTITADQFRAYQEGKDNALYMDDLTEIDTTNISVTGSLTSGEYYLVFDNTGMYGASPNGEVTVDFDISLRLVSEEYFEFQSALDSRGLSYDELYVSENFTSWVMSTRAPPEDIRAILFVYAQNLPAETSRHQELVMEANPVGENQPATLRVPRGLAQRFQNGELARQQYIEQIISSSGY